jgi:hypothetical protein
MMQRRDFLRLSATALVATFGRNLRAAVRFVRPSMELSIAFREDGDAFTAMDTTGAGDVSFLRDGAVIRILSFRGPYAANLDAIYSIGGQAIRFQAASIPSAPTRFTMPVDAIDGLRFEITPRDHAPIPLRLSVNAVPGAIPLRRGTYAVALHPRNVRPDWDALEAGEPTFSMLLFEVAKSRAIR